MEKKNGANHLFYKKKSRFGRLIIRHSPLSDSNFSCGSMLLVWYSAGVKAGDPIAI